MPTLSCNKHIGPPPSSSLQGVEIKTDKKFISGYNPINADSSINVVIEIPAGTHAKWEVEKHDETMRLQYIDQKPRMIDYLAYPANYGMIPQSILPIENGGDGDPLDVIVLGRRIERAQVVKCKLIGILRLLDNGEQDDKLIAVPLVDNFSNISDLKELQERYHGVTTIIETWFSNYKGPNEMVSMGYSDKPAAMKVLRNAVANYTK